MLIQKFRLVLDFDKMRKTVLLFTFVILGIYAHAQDAIIYRDGRVRLVKIIQTNNDKTLFKEWGNKHAAEEYEDNTKVFMLRFKTRGNVVFNRKGERILTTSEPVQIPKDAIVVYYKDGRMVPAYNLTMDAENVSFKTSKSNKKKDNGRLVCSPRSEVFMISYPDGTRDILTNLAVEEEKQRRQESEAAQLKIQQEQALAEVNAAAEEEQAASVSNPKRATIVTKGGAKMKVWVCGETSSSVSYKKVNTAKAAIFRMSKGKIKNIIY